MTSFQLAGLDPQPFAELFHLSDDELSARAIRRVCATADVGFPCRISLEDARVGDELLLLCYRHQRADSPYRSSGPIFIRRHVQRATPEVGEVPPVITRRQISLRGYDRLDQMIVAELVDGVKVGGRLAALFEDEALHYIHLHYAVRGCFACAATPVRPG